MKYTGLLTSSGKLYYFIYSFNKQKICCTVFNSSIIEQNKQLTLNPESLIKSPKKVSSDYIEGSIVVTDNDFITYGNTFVVNLALSYLNYKDLFKSKDLISKKEIADGVIEEYKKTQGSMFCRKVETVYKVLKISQKTSEETLTYKNVLNEFEFRINDNTLKILNSNPDVGCVSFKLDYVPLESTDEIISNSKDLISSTKAKSLAYLRFSRDLSFYYNKDGSIKKRYRIVNSSEKLKDILEVEVKDKVTLWAVDIETTGLLMYKANDVNKSMLDHTVSIMVSWKKDEALFIPIDMVYIKNIDADWVGVMKPYLETIGAVGANISFDARGLYSEFNIHLNIKHDVLQLAFVINCFAVENHNNLKELEHQYLGVDTLTLKDIFGTSKLAGLFRYLSEELALIYACPDVDMCLQLFYILLEKLPKSCYKSYKLDMDTISNLYLLDSIGNKVDVELALKYREANNKDKEILKNLIYKIVGQQLALVHKYMELKSIYNEEKEDEALIMAKEIEEFTKTQTFNEASKEFNIASDDLGKYMYSLLGYPVYAIQEKTKKPAVNAPVLKKLMEQKFSSEEERAASSIGNATGYLKEDIISAISNVIGKTEVLINAKEFNLFKYPLAYLIVEYRLREKRDNTFYHQIIDTNMGGLYYTSTKSAQAKTARLINVIQVLQSYMKRLIVPYNENYYSLVFDFSQIEYRVMTGLSGFKDLKLRLDSPRADFHKEGGSFLLGKAPHLITKAERSEIKSTNFAIPYGFGLRQLCITLYKNPTEENMIKTANLMHTWKTRFKPIWDLLEKGRDLCLKRGFVESVTHRRRPFIKEYPFKSEEEEIECVERWASEMSSAKRSVIRRESGNFLIQETAAHIFKIAFNNFRRRLKEEGLEDKVLTTALIHDEMVSSVHKSVNPYYLYKIIYEEVMMTIAGHPRYYAGISVVDNWYEGKADEFEAPIEFVENIIFNSEKSKNKYLDNWETIDHKNMVYNDIVSFMQDLLKTEYAKLGIDFNSDTLDVGELIRKNTDYFILDKISVYWPMDKKFKDTITKEESKYANDKFIRSFEKFALELGIRDSYNLIYPEDYPLGIYGTITKDSRIMYDEDHNVTLIQSIVKEEKKKEDLTLDLDLDFDVTLVNDFNLDLTNIDEEDFTKLSSVDELELYNEFNIDTNSSAVYYFLPDTDKVNPDLDIFDNPDKYITKNFNAKSEKAIQFSKDDIIIDGNMLAPSGLEELLIHLKKYKSTRLGSVPVYVRDGKTFNKLDFKIKGFDVDELFNIVDKYTVTLK